MGEADPSSGSSAPAPATPESAADPDLRVAVTREVGPSIMPGDLSAAAGTSELRDPLLAAVAAAPDASPPASELEPGVRVGESFRIERRLGSGGMGVVYLARDESLDRLVAVKLHRAGAGVDRLQREAMAMARLTHPNVITVHEVGRLGDRVFVAMEFVAGGTVRSWLKAEPRTWQQSLAVCIAAGEGLAAAHDAGLVHRDFKPENVLVGDDGRPRVGDFGLARAVGDSSESMTTLEDRASRRMKAASNIPAADADAMAETVQLQPPSTADAPSPSPTPPESPAPSPPPSSGSGRSHRGILSDRLTMTGVLVGTPAYMAPEQFAGADVDAKADQFAFAVMTWEVLHGKRPFSGSTAEKVRAAVEAGRINPPPRDTAVPARVRAILTRALAVAPADRWPSMHALLAELRAAARPSRKGLIIGGGAIALAASAAIAWAAWPRTPADPCADVARAMDAQVPPAMIAKMLDIVERTGGDSALLDRTRVHLASIGPNLRAAAIQSCRAAKVEHQISPELYERSQACLAMRARVTAILVDEPGLAAKDPTAYSTRSHAIPSLQACDDAVALAAAVPRRDEPAIAARALLWAAGADVATDRFAEAEEGIRRALALAPPDDRGARALAMVVQGHLAYVQDRLPEAAKLLADAYYAGVALDDTDVYLVALEHLITLHGSDRFEPAASEPWIRAGIAAVDKDRRRAIHNVLPVLRALVGAADRRGDYAQSVAWAQQLGELAPRNLPPAARAEIDWSLAQAYAGANRIEESIAAYQAAIDGFGTAYGPTHPRTAEVLTDYGLVLVEAGRDAEVPPVVTRARVALAAWPGTRSSRRANALLNFGVLLTDDPSDFAEAEAAYRDARATFAEVYGPDHVDVALCDANLAVLDNKRGNPRGAIVALERALAIHEKAYGASHYAVGRTIYNLAAAAIQARDYRRAEAAATRAEEIFNAHSPGSAIHLYAMTRRARALNGQGKFTAALELARRTGRMADTPEEADALLSAQMQEAFALLCLGQDVERATAILDDAHARYSEHAAAYAVTLADLAEIRSKRACVNPR